MVQANSFDLEIALQKLHELSMEDGELGYEYWHKVGQLLRRAAGMEAQIDSLGSELERCRALLAQHEWLRIARGIRRRASRLNSLSRRGG
jgi:hypothetical protein